MKSKINENCSFISRHINQFRQLHISGFCCPTVLYRTDRSALSGFHYQQYAIVNCIAQRVFSFVSG